MSAAAADGSAVLCLQDLCCQKIGVLVSEYVVDGSFETSASSRDKKTREVEELLSILPVYTLERLLFSCSARVLDSLHDFFVRRRVRVENAWSAFVKQRWGMTREKLKRPSAFEALG